VTRRPPFDRAAKAIHHAREAAGGWKGSAYLGTGRLNGPRCDAHGDTGPSPRRPCGARGLLERVTADPEDVKILRRSIRELGRLAGDTQDLLTWAASVRHLRPMEADIVQVVNEAVDSCRMETGRTSGGGRAAQRPGPIDAPQLRSAVTNLIRNALAYADPGTKVEITLRERRDEYSSASETGDPHPGRRPRQDLRSVRRGSAKGHVGEQSGLGLYITRGWSRSMAARSGSNPTGARRPSS